MQKEEYECPWCGMHFEEPQELEKHAKNHYLTRTLSAQVPVR